MPLATSRPSTGVWIELVTTVAPSAASASASARPRPRLLPVTSATLPLNRGWLGRSVGPIWGRPGGVVGAIAVGSWVMHVHHLLGFGLRRGRAGRDRRGLVQARDDVGG